MAPGPSPGRAERMAWHPVAVTQENSSPPTSSPQISSTDEATIDAVAVRDLVDVPAVEVVMTLAVHLMTAAAVRCGLADDPEASHQVDLAEARILITALAGLVMAATPDLGAMHAAPLKDGLSALQRAFRDASPIPDAPGDGPGERLTGSRRG